MLRQPRSSVWLFSYSRTDRLIPIIVPAEDFCFNDYGARSGAQFSNGDYPPMLPDSAIGSSETIDFSEDNLDERRGADSKAMHSFLPVAQVKDNVRECGSPCESTSTPDYQSTSQSDFQPLAQRTEETFFTLPNDSLTRSNRPCDKLCMPRSYQDELRDMMLKPSGLSMSSQEIMRDCYEQAAMQASPHDHPPYMADWNQAYPQWYSADY